MTTNENDIIEASNEKKQYVTKLKRRRWQWQQWYY
jgi:hypothetical protein